MIIEGSESEYVDIDWTFDVTPQYIYNNMDEDELNELSELMEINGYGYGGDSVTMDNKEKLDFLKANIWDITLKDLEEAVQKNKSKFK